MWANNNQARTRSEDKDKLFGSGDRPVGRGFSTRRGGGRKVRALTRKFVFLGFEERNLGCPGSFAGMSWNSGSVQKVRAKTVRAQSSFPR